MKDQAVLLFLGGLGGGEIIIIMLVVLLLFGAKRIPDFARSLGSGIREFKDAANGMRHELERSVTNKESNLQEQTFAGPPGQAVSNASGLPQNPQQGSLTHTTPGNTP